MRICIISYVFNLNNTSRANAVFEALNKNNYVELYYADFDHYSKEKKVYKNNKLMPVEVPKYKKNMSFSRMYSTVTFGIKSKKMLEKKHFDMIYIILPPNFAAYYIAKWTKKKNVKLIIDIVDLHPESIPINKKIKHIANYLGLFTWKFYRNKAMKYSDLVMVECNYYKKFIPKKYYSKVETLYITKDSSLIDYDITMSNYNKSLSILFLGSIGHIYDLENLVKLGVELKKLNIEVTYSIIGDGERREWLLEQFKLNKLKFKYYGKIYNEDEKQKIMKTCDFGFNGFKKETNVGLSYKSLDYMDYGLALINSTKHDTWNIIDQYNIGINYDPDNIESLTHNIKYLDKHEINKMKKNSREIFKKEFSKSTFEEKISTLIEKFN